MKPIIFSTPMVCAILEGRKTMTRRVIKPQPIPMWDACEPVKTDAGIITWCFFNSNDSDIHGYVKRIPYSVGDILWVRETWNENPAHAFGKNYDGLPPMEQYAVFRATSSEFGGGWRPSIFMPRRAARLFLRVTDVRAERVREILCGDMKREGCIPPTVTGGQYQQWQRDYFAPLWDSLNAKRGYGWDANPWVWVISFERISKEEAEVSE